MMTKNRKSTAVMLTDAAVRKLKSGRRRREVLDKGSRSLYLVIQPSGAKSWAVRFKIRGKRFKLTLGTVDLSGKELEDEPQVGGHLTLAAARRLASEVHRQRAQGRDPVAEKKAAKVAASIEASPTGFLHAARSYVEQQVRDKKQNRTWRTTAIALGLKYEGDGPPTVIKNSLVNRWRDRPVSEITDADVFAAADEAASTALPGRAARNRGRSNARERELINAMSGLFKWLRRRRLIAALPTSGLERVPSGRRDRVLTADELRRLWMVLPDDSPLGAVVKVMILTGQRRGEVSGMRRSEIAEDGSTWTIPAERSKNKIKHDVPLAPAVQELIAKFSHESLVFTTKGRNPVSGFSNLKAWLDKRLEFTPDWRLHDLRRTVATMMAESGVEPHIVEEVLGHTSYKAGVAGLYNRASYEARKKAELEMWALRVEAIVEGREEKTIVPLRA
jgi:integrase